MAHAVKQYDANLDFVDETISLDADDSGTARVSVGASSGCKVVIYESQTTPTTIHNFNKVRLFSVTPGDADFVQYADLADWTEGSLPVYSPVTLRHYVVLHKDLTNGDGASLDPDRDDLAGSACLVDITGSDPTLGDSDYNYALRCAAVLDNYTDLNTITLAEGGLQETNIQKPFVLGNEISVGGTYKATAKSVGFEFRRLRTYDVSNTVCSTDVISGGVTSIYDGRSASEIGWVEVPTVNVLPDTSGTTIAAGNYNYVAVLEEKDFLGNSHFSQVSRPAEAQLVGTDQVKIDIALPSVTNHGYKNLNGDVEYGSSVIHLYRTESGGTQYYLVASRNVTAAAANTHMSVVDTMTDAVLIGKPLLYRQPGTVGTPLDRRPALASSCCVRHKDRVFYARGKNVYFSSFAVDGEAPWFSPAFTFAVPGGTGNITALASMDGLLVIFKENAVFLVDGDGPPENGGSGAEFSPPRQVLTEFGCIDARSLVATPNGLMYRSGRGIELLNRSLQVANFHGERVYRTVDANPYTGGATFDPVSGRVLFVMGATAGSYTGSLSSSGNGVVVAYEVSSDTWSVYKLNSHVGYGKAFQDVCTARYGTEYKVFYGDSYCLWIEDETGSDSVYVISGETGTVTDKFIPQVIETGFIRAPSKQDRVRVTDFLCIGEKESSFNVKTSYAYDYGASYTAIKTWTNSVLTTDLCQLETQPPRELVQSMSFRLETTDPTTGYGAGYEIFGLTARVGLKGGGAKLAASQKG